MVGHNSEMFVVLSHWSLTSHTHTQKNSQDTIYQLQNKRKTSELCPVSVFYHIIHDDDLIGSIENHTHRQLFYHRKLFLRGKRLNNLNSTT